MPRTRAPAPSVDQVLVTLQRIKPAIWRRLLLPSNMRLGTLHRACPGAPCELTRMFALVTGVAWSAVVGSARLLNVRGVAWRSVVGSVLGGVVIMLLAEPLRLNQPFWLLLLTFASAALLGALVGFQPWRRQRGAAA